MSERRIRVLVVDDSAFMRKVLVKMLEPYEDIEVVATAMDGVFALEKLERTRPDVVTLDLEMPRMDGRTALQHIVDDFQLPVVLVSAHTSSGAQATFDALAAGAVDFVTKPERIFSTPLDALSTDLVHKIRAAARARVRRPFTRCAPSDVHTGPGTAGAGAAATEIVAMGVSTGGPNALSLLLPAIRADFGPGIVIVQHMPAGFTGQFADRLSRLSAIAVKEAEEGDIVTSGTALIAPGGRHIEILRSGTKLVVQLSSSAAVRGHRPSADVLFASVAKAAGARACGIILTGMGEDGAEGLLTLHSAGGHTLAQDEASSVVYGMPRAAIERGAVDKVMSLAEIGPYLNTFGRQRGSTWIA